MPTGSVTLPLERLRTLLKQALAGRPRRAAWGQPQAMSNSLEAVWASFGKRTAKSRDQRIARGLMAFRIQGPETEFIHLKYACLGIAFPMDWESRRLLADPVLFQHLLQRVQDFRQDSRRFKVCYQSLLQAFAEMEPTAATDPAVAANFQILQDFLQQEKSNSLFESYRQPQVDSGY